MTNFSRISLKRLRLFWTVFRPRTFSDRGVTKGPRVETNRFVGLMETILYQDDVSGPEMVKNNNYDTYLYLS